MKSIFNNKNIRIYTKINILKAYILWPILLRGCECWTLTKDIVKRRSNGNGRIQKIPTQNHQKKTTANFWAYKQS